MVQTAIKLKRSVPPQGAYKTATHPQQIFAKLASNENPYGPSPKVLKAAQSLSSETIFRYPDPLSVSLRKKLAQYTGSQFEKICCFAGVDEAIRFVAAAFLEKNSKVIAVSPTFAIYPLSTAFHGAQLCSVPLEKDFSFSARTLTGILEQIAQGADLACLCNPDNPTGMGIARKDLEKIIDACHNKNIPIVVDEAYYEFSGNTVADLVEKYENLIVFRSMSKAFGLAGLRLGYMIAGEQLTGEALRAKPVFNISGVAQVLGEAALDDLPFMRKNIQKIIASREKLSKQLAAMGLKVYPSQGNFLLVQTGERVFEQLLAQGVDVRGFSFPSYSDKFSRISIGTEQDNKLVVSTLQKLVLPHEKKPAF